MRRLTILTLTILALFALALPVQAALVTEPPPAGAKAVCQPVYTLDPVTAGVWVNGRNYCAKCVEFHTLTRDANPGQRAVQNFLNNAGPGIVVEPPPIMTTNRLETKGGIVPVDHQILFCYWELQP
jgi:hypothetical protein